MNDNNKWGNGPDFARRDAPPNWNPQGYPTGHATPVADLMGGAPPVRYHEPPGDQYVSTLIQACKILGLAILAVFLGLFALGMIIGFVNALVGAV